MKYFIGIDIGTSGTKAILFDEQGETRGKQVGRYKISYPAESMAEQNPDDYYFATLQTIKKIVSQSGINPSDVLAIGLGGQMHGLILLDKEDKVLRPAIIWCDNRTSKEAEQLKAVFGDKLATITGTIANPAFTLAKLLWVKNNEPQTFAKISKVLLPKDYVRYMLTGIFQSDYSDMSGTQMMDILTYDYDKEILDFLGLTKENFPVIGSSFKISGPIRQNLLHQLGLTNKTLVVGGAGDQAASAFGNATFTDETINISLGSSGVIFAPSSLMIDKSGAIQTFAYYDKNQYHVMGVTQGCGISLNWLRKTFYTSNSTYTKLEEEVLTVQLQKKLPLYLPYIQGERTPILNPNARGVIFGLTNETQRPEIAYAVLEGVAFSFRHSLDALKKLGVNAKTIRVCGGAVKNRVFLQIIADVLQKELIVPDHEETGCLGVAIMAAIGVGHFATISQAFKQMSNPKTTIVSPNTTTIELYNYRFGRYLTLYDSLIDMFD